MYNRYVRDKDGNYTRMTIEDDMPPVPLRAAPPPPPGQPPAVPPPPPAPAGAPPPPLSHPGPSHAPPPPAPPFVPPYRPFQQLLRQIRMEDVDAGDLLLLFLLFFLFRRDADEELLTALGLLLIL